MASQGRCWQTCSVGSREVLRVLVRRWHDRVEPIAPHTRPNRYPNVFKQLRLRPLSDQLAGIGNIARAKAFGEAIVGFGEQVAGICNLAAAMPQSGETHGGA
jgi:hypothetical protein